MGGDAKNGAGVDLINTWGRKIDNRKTATEREGWEMVLPLPGGGHEGSGVSINKDVNK